MVPFERALVSAMGPPWHSNLISPLSLRNSDIAAFVLQHTNFPHPTSSDQHFIVFIVKRLRPPFVGGAIQILFD